ncbi:MAG: NADH-quinone oxidoreductase subunit M [Geminicoccales bacterium]
MKYLSLLTVVPLLGALAVAFVPRTKPELAKRLALLVSVAVLGLAVATWFAFRAGGERLQLRESYTWIPAWDAKFTFAVDGISLVMLILTALLVPIVILASWRDLDSGKRSVPAYFALILALEGTMIGTFAAADVLLFYLFFEVMLVPMYFLIGSFGQDVPTKQRHYAAVKFFLYTLAGSLLMLVALLYLYGKSGGSFAVLDWHKLPLSLTAQQWLFFGFLLAFAVKVPMWPVHTWLPDAHVEAPTGGSVVLAAIMLKLGAYGFIRFSLPILPDAARELAWLMIALSLIAVVYIGLVALVQADLKKLIAYSSISHMGFVTLGFFVFNAWGVEGALVQMISHGFVSAALFLCVGVLYDRMHTRMIADYGGVANTMPRFASLLMLFAMANCGLPATSGFVGEFMVILGAMQANFWLAFAAATTLVFGAAYTLWMYKRVVFGAVANEHVGALKDLEPRELLVLGLLAAAVLFMGVYPLPFTEVMHASVDELLRHVALSKL